MEDRSLTAEEEQNTAEETRVQEFVEKRSDQEVKKIEGVETLESQAEEFLENSKENEQSVEVREDLQTADNGVRIRTADLGKPGEVLAPPEVIVVPLELAPASATRKETFLAQKRVRRRKRESVTVIRILREFCLAGLLIAAVFAYAILGAILFLNLEQERDIAYHEHIDKWKNDTAILLATELRQVIPHEEVWVKKIFRHLEVFEKDLLKASALGYKGREDGCQRWSLESAFAFSMSLMSTTGFGAMSLRSDWGRAAAVGYSLCGVPLMFSCLYKCGLYLSVLWLYLFHLLCPVTDYSSAAPSSRPPRPKLNSVSPTAAYQAQRSARDDGTRRVAAVDTLLRHPEHFPHIPSFLKDVRDHVADSCAAEDPGKKWHHRTVGCAETLLRSVERPSKLNRAVAIVFALLLLAAYAVLGCAAHFAAGVAIEDGLFLNYLMLATLGSGCHELDDDISRITTSWKFAWPCFLFFGYCLLSMILHLFFSFKSVPEDSPSPFKVLEAEDRMRKQKTKH